MAILVTLDLMMARRKMRLNDLADAVGVSIQNLSILKTGKARAVRFSTLSALCAALQCQPGDIMTYVEGPDEDVMDVRVS
jgi:putative transcriptional regulator